jgi:uncharacterized membrane-anchored protein
LVAAAPRVREQPLGIGYAGGTTLLCVCLMALLRCWYLSQGTISVDTVATAKAEPFCWAAITFSQTLGTALGDWVADTGGLGYEGGALVFATGLAVIAGLYFWTNVLRILLSGQPSSSRGRSAGLFVLP